MPTCWSSRRSSSPLPYSPFDSTSRLSPLPLPSAVWWGLAVRGQRAARHRSGQAATVGAEAGSALTWIGGGVAVSRRTQVSPCREVVAGVASVAGLKLWNKIELESP